MSGIPNIGSVGPALQPALFQVKYAAAAAEKEQQVVHDIGTAALKLIQASMAQAPLGAHLDEVV